MKLKLLLGIGLGLWLASAGSIVADFVLVDSFEVQETGPLEGLRGWTSQGFDVVVEPGNQNNQVLTSIQAERWASLELNMGKNPLTTLFFRLRVEVNNDDPINPILNWGLGLSSSGEVPTNGMDLIDAQVRQNRDPDAYYFQRIQVRDGDNYLPLEDLIPQIWYGVWMLCDAEHDTYQIYMIGGRFTVPTRIQDFTGQFDFALPQDRHFLETMRFCILTGLDHQASFFVDDLYIDILGHNLSEPPHPPVLPRVSNVYPLDGTRYYAPAAGLGFTVSTTPTNSLPTNNILLSLDGVDVSADLDIRGTTTRRQATFSQLRSNQLYHAVITITDHAGLTTTVPFSFDTFSEGSIINIDAEHYNFQAGQHIDSPVLSDTPSTSNYLAQVAIEGVDYHTVSNDRYRIYRTNDGLGFLLSGDAPRAEYVAADIPEVDVGPCLTGEWMNYTRTFPTNSYQVYVRLGAITPNSTVAELDWVASSADTNDQPTLPLGVIRSSSSVSAFYGYWPLADAFGNPMVVSLGGVQTLRLTVLAGGFLANYLALIPHVSTNPQPPYVSRLIPVPGAVGVMPDTPIEVAIVDRDSRLLTNSVRLKLDARDVSSSLSITRQHNVTLLRYQSTAFLQPSSQHKVTLVYAGENAPLSPTTNAWWFTVVSNVVQIPAQYALPAGSGRISGFTERLVQAAAVPELPSTIARAEYQLAEALVFEGKAVSNEWRSLAYLPTVNLRVASSLASSSASSGFFSNDAAWITRTNHARNLAAEVVTYLALNRGCHRLGIYSESSYRLTTGTNPHHLGLVVGSQNGASPGGETIYNVLVLTNGVYPFRLVWEQPSGNGNLEWYELDPARNTRVLLNDLNASVAAFRYAANTTNPVTVIEQPSDQVHAVSQQATFAVQLSSSSSTPVGIFYQWQTNQNNIWGETAAEHTTLPLTLADNGLKFRCVITVPGYRNLFSDEAVLTVVDDTNAPTLVQATGHRLFNRVRVSFSEPLRRSSAEDVLNYTLSEGLSVLSAWLDDTGTNVYLTTSAQQPDTRYILAVSGVEDLVGWAVAPESRALFTSFVLANGYLAREIYRELPGSNVVDLTSEPRFQNVFPDEVSGLNRFEIPASGQTNYGQQVLGYLTPPESGNYVFRLAASDTAELWLSTDENLRHTALIARVEKPTESKQWTNDWHQTSGPITLIAGQHYYLEVLHKAASTNDHVELGWIIPSRSGLTNATEIIKGDYLSTFVNPDAAQISITQQPRSISVPLGKTATFTVAATGQSGFGTNSQFLLYQWQKNGLPISGALESSYTTPAVATNDNGSVFACLLTVPGRSIYSSNATLTVTEAIDLGPLFISRSSNHWVEVSWVSSQTNIVLESNLACATNNWIAAPETAVQDGATNRVAIPAVDNRFFRLRLP